MGFVGIIGTRRATAIVALAASGLLLAACSSEPEATPTASTSSSAVAPSPSTSASAAAAACAAYFELDLLNSAYAGGAVADGDMTEEQVRDDFTSLLKELKAQAKAAVADGSADAKMLVNAKRMKKTVKALTKTQALSELSKKQQQRFANSSLRVQKACDRAGLPLPADNVTAREAAGL